MRLSVNYFIAFVSILIVEILIAVYVNDNFIRPYLGDSIVVILIYTFFMAILNLEKDFKIKTKVAVYVLLFAFTIEGLQATDLINYLGLGDVKLAKVILGTSFSWWDILAYLGGFVVILFIEKITEKSL